MNLVGIPLVFVSLLAIQDKPAPKPPVAKDGAIDYEARLNDILSKGITPETNANVLIWQALGPSPEGGSGMPPEFFKRLGIPKPPKRGDYFIGLTEYTKSRQPLSPDEFSALWDEETRASRRPWTAKDHPRLASWLNANEKPLALVIEATKRPQYYSPVIATRSGSERGLLIGALMPAVQKCRELTAALCTRAMLRVAEGKTDEAWQDILAAHRLGRLVAHGGTNLDALVGIAIDASATNANLAYLASANLTSNQLRDRLKDLQALPPMPPMADKIDTGERHIALDAIQDISRGAGLDAGESIIEDLRGLTAIDWPLIRREFNLEFDRMSAALRIKDRVKREKAFGKVESELHQRVEEAKKLREAFKKTGDGDIGTVVARSIGSTLLGLLSPSIRKVQSSFDRAEQIERNLHIAFALAAYHADTGRYPARLADLAPRYLPAPPTDLFTGKPLVYKPAEKGYLFYSVGQNEKDEEGRSFEDDPRGDDLVVRMPLPVLKRDK